MAKNRIARVVSLLIILSVLLAYGIPFIASAETATVLGDVNADGVINQYDYLLVKRHHFATRTLTEAEFARADVNMDGNVNQYDYLLVARHYFGTYTIVSPHSHVFGDWENDDKNHWKQCSCGEKSETAKHSFVSVVTPPTEEKDGYTTHTCDKCEYSYVDSYVSFKFSEGFEYKVNEDGVTCTIIGIGTCKDTVLYFPSVIDGYTVTRIEESAFEHCNNITAINIPDSIREIKQFAFKSCGKLQEITVGNGLTVLEPRAFENCNKLTTTYEDLIYVGNKNNPYLILIDTTVYDTERTECTIHPQTKVIADFALWGMPNLTEVIIPDGVVSLTSYSLVYLDKLTSVTIPDSVLNIGDSAFMNCWSLTEIDLPDNVKYIGSSAFELCKTLTEINIPDSVTYMGDGVFRDSPNLKNINFSGTIEQWTSIDKHDTWDADSANFTVYCTDGEIAKDGTVTKY